MRHQRIPDDDGGWRAQFVEKPDANALIAMAWPTHQHHQRIPAWFKLQSRNGWATRPFTQAAFVRIVSQPAFSGATIGHTFDPREAAALLTLSLAHRRHIFFPLDLPVAEVAALCAGGLIGHRQVTGACLLALAVKRTCRLVTFGAGLKELLATERECDAHIEWIG